MRKYRKILLFILFLLLTACTKNLKYDNNSNAKLSGTIVKEEDKTYLDLDEPIIINETTYNKIELDFDKELKDNYKVTIDGVIKDAILAVDSIDNSQAYKNTYSNSIFKLTIPSSIIELITIKEIDNGFTIYSTNNMSNGGEVVTIKSLTTSEYKKAVKNNKLVLDRITSNQTNTIVAIYPTTIEYNKEYAKEYENIVEHINNIKKSIKLY